MKGPIARQSPTGIRPTCSTHFLIALALLSAACSDDSGTDAQAGGARPTGGAPSAGGSGGGRSSGGTQGVVPDTFSPTPPGSTPLSDLSDTESAALCKEADAFLVASGYVHDACTVMAYQVSESEAAFSETVTDAELQAYCVQTYADCSASASFAGPPCNPPLENCTATVDEYATCLDDTTVRVRRVANELPECSALQRSTFEAEGSPLDVLQTAPSCELFQQKCLGPE